MSTASSIPLPAKLDLSAPNLPSEFRRFESEWLRFAKATKVYSEEKDCQVAILLAFLGTDAFCLYETMNLPDAHRESPAAILKAFERHCIEEIPEVSEQRFGAATAPEEEVHAFSRASAPRVRTRAARRRRQGDRRSNFRSRVSSYASQRQHSSEDDSNDFRKRGTFTPRDSCGRQHPRISFKTSQACGEYKKYAIACEEKASHDNVKKPADRSILVLNDDASADKRIYADILVNGFFVKFALDSGSTVNTIPKSIYDIFPRKPALQPVKDNIRMFNNLQLTTAGTVNVILTHPRTGKQLSTEAYITEQEHPVLSISACRALNLIEINYANICDDSGDSIQTMQQSSHSDNLMQEMINADDSIQTMHGVINSDDAIQKSAHESTFEIYEIDDDFLIEVDEAGDERYESMIEIDESEIDEHDCNSFDGIFELFDDADDNEDEKADDEDDRVECTANAEKLCDLFKENLDSLESEYVRENCTANSENFCKGTLSLFENDEEDDNEDFTEMPSTRDFHSSNDESVNLFPASENPINSDRAFSSEVNSVTLEKPFLNPILDSTPTAIESTAGKDIITAAEIPTAELSTSLPIICTEGSGINFPSTSTDVLNASQDSNFQSDHDNSTPVQAEFQNLLHLVHSDTNERLEQNAPHCNDLTSDRRREESHICEELKVDHSRPPAFNRPTKKFRSSRIKFKEKPMQKGAEKDKHRSNRRETQGRG